MVERVTFPADVAGSEPPVADAAPLTGTEKALADTKAELTRVQQELAALKKPAEAAPQDAAPAANAGTDAPPAGTDAPEPDQQAAADAVKAAGLDVSPWQAEFDSTGDVSEEGRAKIAEALKAQFGEDARAVVDQFIDGRKASASQSVAQTAELFAAGGGEEGYKEMAAWAKTALTPDEIAQFDAVVSTGDHKAALFAIKGLRSRYEAANGREPKLINAGAVAAPAPQGFRSKAEMVRAMSDPRYQTDPAYRSEVEQKIVRSQF